MTELLICGELMWWYLYYFRRLSVPSYLPAGGISPEKSEVVCKPVVNLMESQLHEGGLTNSLNIPVLSEELVGVRKKICIFVTFQIQLGFFTGPSPSRLAVVDFWQTTFRFLILTIQFWCFSHQVPLADDNEIYWTKLCLIVDYKTLISDLYTSTQKKAILSYLPTFEISPKIGKGGSEPIVYSMKGQLFIGNFHYRLKWYHQLEKLRSLYFTRQQ